VTEAVTVATSGPRVCVIGAGPCGLATIKNLIAAGIGNIVCYDERDTIGGNWVFTDARGRSSVYETTQLISSRRYTEFADFPMPADYPDYPFHWQMRAYLDAYATHFSLLPFVRLQTRVEQAELSPDGKWRVRLSETKGRADEVFDHLIVCSGHHHAPLLPQYPGHFDGESRHSVDYKRAAPFAGKRVLVVGGGNSACDIAAEISRVAARTCISMRRGYWILPKRVRGEPVDNLYAWLRMLPRPIVPPASRVATRLIVGSWAKYGLQKPQGAPVTMHPTLNTVILAALRERRVIPRVAIERLDGGCVRFRDGASDVFDAIVWATGFRVVFPFLGTDIVDWDTAKTPPLYLKMMHERIANLFFVGLFQPLGCIWRLADYQARIAALQIAGRLARPEDIESRIDHEMHTPHWRFDATPRHAI
jgi:cation diffusion facilitator CzcD-associated flavoprotein CzcO